jgi:large subunit ribosomal protein L35
MPKLKSHKGLLKRIKITKSGKVKFRSPNSRHLKSNKSGEKVQSYRRSQYVRRGMLNRLSLMLHRPLMSQERHEAIQAEKAEMQAATGAGAEATAPKTT